MGKRNFTLLALLLIIFVGAFLRLFLLGQYPSGFFRDEAALGYNAYSLWLTGSDEYGYHFPIVFRSFEVFFLPLYGYLTAIVVGIIGLSEFSTRFLSAVSGVILLFVAYFISKEIWNEKTALFSVLVLAISPWHIFYSRGVFEGNLALTVFSLGFLFWLKFLKKSRVLFFFLSAFFFSLSMYSYQSERLVVPLVALFALYVSFGRVWGIKRKLVFPVILIVIILLPILSLSLKPGGYHRAFGVSIFSQNKKAQGRIDGVADGFLINNEFYLRTRQISALYLSYFSPRNLFIEGDFDKQRSVENFSVFYSWMFPFLVIGAWVALTKRTVRQYLLLTWMFIAPLPAALTGDPFHTYRSLLLYLPVTFLIGLGLSKAFELSKNRIFIVGIVTVSLISISSFSYNYFVITQLVRARAWDYGYKELTEFLLNQVPLGDKRKVVIDDMWTTPYIHFLFFAKVNPKLYFNEVASLGPLESYYYTNSDKMRPNKLQNYEFRKVDWETERGNPGSIFAISADKLPEDAFNTDPKIELIKEIKYPTGEIAYRVVWVK